MLSHNLPVKIEPQQNEAYNTKFKTNVVWNQKLKDPHFEATASPRWRANTAYGTYTIGSNKITYTIATKNANEAIVQDSVSFTQGHVYLTSFWVTTSENQIVASYTGNSVVNLGTVTANERTRIVGIFPANKTGVRSHYIYVGRNGGIAVGGTAVLEDCCLYDLTVMFGEGKEYIGREMFFKNFMANYYDYDESETSVPFTWTVYGGSLDVKTGALAITHSRYEFTGTEGWTLQSGSTLKYWTNASDSGYLVRKAKLPANNNSSVPINTDIGNFNIAYNNLQNYQYSMCIASDSRLAIHSTLYSGQGTLEGIGVVYELATAVTFQLSPAEVKTLLGNNKISSNATELQLTYKNSQNENVSLEGSNEYTIEDGVFDREVVSATNLFSYKQNLNGWICPYLPGLGPIKLDFEPVQGSESGIDYDTTQRVYGDNFVLFDSHGNAPSTSATYIDVDIPVRNGNFYNQGSSTLSISIPTAHWPGRQVTLDNLMLYVKLLNEEMGIQDGLFIFDLNEPISFTDTLSNNNRIAYVEISLLKKDTETFLPVFLPLIIQYDYSDTVTPINYNVLPVPHYTNICPIEGYTESSVTVEGDRVSDSESERRLKAITRPVFQWDFGLKLKFEGYSFADGTLCQFDNKITAYSLNATIENNECTIPYQLLDENCQGDIVAYINVSGNNYDVVVYEVYIPVIKRPKPENFLRPAINLPSAVIASFADGADGISLEKLKIAVTPKQDLHGYDYPWVGGGGKNICPNILTSQEISGIIFTVNSDGTIKATGKATALVVFNITDGWHPIKVKANVAYAVSGCPSGGSATTFNLRITTTPSGSGTICDDYGSGQLFTPTSDDTYGCRLIIRSGYECPTAGLLFKPQVEASASPTSYAPYENICPITGYTEANVTRTGKNLWDEVWEQGAISVTTGQNSSGNGIRSKNYIPITPSASYYLYIGLSTVLYHPVIYYDADKNFLSAVTTQVWNRVFTVPNNAYYMRFYVNSAYGTSYNNDIAINYPSTVTTYESYAGQTYNIPFTDIGTVYGGTLDVKTGVLTVTRAYVGGEGWTQYNSSNGFKAYRRSAPYSKATSSEYSIIEPISNGISVFSNFNSSSMSRNQIQPPTSSYTTCYMALDENVDPSTIYFSYLMKDPVTYQLTPTEVKTLLGYNNIWADTGEVEVSYYADPYLHFID